MAFRLSLHPMACLLAVRPALSLRGAPIAPEALLPPEPERPAEKPKAKRKKGGKK